MNKSELAKKAQQIRLDIIKMLAQAQSGHPAGALGMADIFAVLYFAVLKHKPQQSTWPERDFVILSNGHICPVLYATLAQAGYFAPEKLTSLRQINSDLQGHPHLGSLPGVENTSGPLGQGISQACGLALGLRMDHQPNHVFCLMSDGEQQEGQVWEAYQLASKYELGNLTVIVDRNHIQIEGQTKEIMPIDPLTKKFNSFGWQTKEIDGHNFSHIEQELKLAKKSKQPTAIIAQTIPGKGVSFMEDKSQWHGKAPNQEQAQQAINELRQALT